ncbi:MAG: hypothetical protein JSS32_01780 [Verrucomicrobia bacterium]|nr:hypothetical protein [Verrucomicrobiota bacterium]
MVKKKYTIFILHLFITVIYGHPCVDINFTPFAGAENLIFLQSGLEKLENLAFPPPKITLEDFQNPEQCPHFSSRNRWIRQGQSILIWAPINASCVVIQHEVFGHGYRVRDLGSKYATVKGYKMYVIGGATGVEATNLLTPSQALTIDIAGVEADAILANRVRLGWLQEGRVDPKQGFLYFFSALSLTAYAFAVNKNPKSPPQNGNDISNFLFLLNSIYSDSKLGYTKLRNLSLICLLDPFTYYSIFAQWIYNAFAANIKVPMIGIKSINYLPSARLALTPFGMQGYFENFLVVNSIPTYLYFKWGKNGTNTYFGFGLENLKIFTWKSGSFGLRADFWHQPPVLFQQGTLSANQLYDLPSGTYIPPLYPDSVLAKKLTGGAITVIGAYSWKKTPLKMFTELGYKTAGYLPGEALRAALIIRGGLSGFF